MSSLERENLKLMRELAGYTQKELGRLSGINPKIIGAYEIGKRNIGRLNGPKLAKAFGLPLEEFFRLLRSSGDSEIIKTWLKLHEVHAPHDANRILKAVQKLINLYQRAQDDPSRQEPFENIMRQIDMFDEILTDLKIQK